MHLVVTHLLVCLASDGTTRSYRMRGSVVVVIRQIACTRIDCTILYRLHLVIRIMIGIGMTLTRIIRINEHIEGIVVEGEVGTCIRQCAPRLDGTIIDTALEILSAIETLFLNIVGWRQVNHNVCACLRYVIKFVCIDLAIVIRHEFLGQSSKVFVFT